MSALALSRQHRQRLGLKGPRAAQWLAANGIDLPLAPNTWMEAPAASAAQALLVARLGNSEFFLEDAPSGTTLERIAPSLQEHAAGVYPVLREDWAFVLCGAGVHEVLAQVCNVNFAALKLATRPLIMTLMIGVAVLVVPQSASGDPGAAIYRIWCDPTFGPYLLESVGEVVSECGGSYTGVSQ